MAELYSQYASGTQFTAGVITGSILGISGINPLVDRLNSISSLNNSVTGSLVSGTSTIVNGSLINGIEMNSNFTKYVLVKTNTQVIALNEEFEDTIVISTGSGTAVDFQSKSREESLVGALYFNPRNRALGSFIFHLIYSGSQGNSDAGSVIINGAGVINFQFGASEDNTGGAFTDLVGQMNSISDAGNDFKPFYDPNLNVFGNGTNGSLFLIGSSATGIETTATYNVYGTTP